MTNPMMNSQPNYSGVTIQIANPAVYAGGYGLKTNLPSERCDINSLCNDSRLVANPQYNTYPPLLDNVNGQGYAVYPQQSAQPQALSYPPQYYLNNYNYQNNGNDNRSDLAKNNSNETLSGKEVAPQIASNPIKNQDDYINALNSKTVEDYMHPQEDAQDLSKSKAVIEDLDTRAAAMEADKKNSTQKNIVALTDEYIKSLENYLNNPNDEIRLMASKEILTRLDEDKDRYNDAALNALLNKMLQDPSKLIRVAALSAFASQLASGNDYTVELLHNIQKNPSADKEDVLQAADILLKMSAGKEVNNIPNPAVKEISEENKGQ